MDPHRELINRMMEWLDHQGAREIEVVQGDEACTILGFRFEDKPYSLTLNETP